MALPWIKLYCEPCLEGSVRVTLTAEERGVLYDLMLLAGNSHGRPGHLERKEGLPLPDDKIAARLNVSTELLQRCLVKFVEQGRLSRNGDNTWQFVNWSKYQAPRKEKKVSHYPNGSITIIENKTGEIL